MVYCYSFSVVTTRSFEWLTEDKSLIKTKLNSLINSVCFRVRSITKEEKHGNYSVKIHREMYITWHMKVYNEKQNTWYMTTYIFCLIVLQTLISAISPHNIHAREKLSEKSYVKILYGLFWFGSVRKTDLLSILVPSVHFKTFIMETFFKIINLCYLNVVCIFSKNEG